MISTIGNLYTLLNNTGLQAKDNATYLVLKGIIDGLSGINTDYATLSGTPPNIFKGTNSFENVVDLDSGQLHFPQIQNSSIDPNTLDDYNIGTWTPVDLSGAGLAFTQVLPANFIKIGKLVIACGFILFPVTANGSIVSVSLPFAVKPGFETSAPIISSNSGLSFTGIVAGDSGSFVALVDLNGNILVNSQFSGKRFGFTAIYISSH